MKPATARPSSASPNAESNGLVPVEQSPEVATAWAVVMEARRDAETVRAQLAQAHARAHPSQTAEHASGPHQRWSPRDFWTAKASLPQLEQEYGLAQATLAEAEDEHRAAVARAKADLEPQVHAWLVPKMAAAIDALTAIDPALEALRVAVSRASELGVSAPSPVLVRTMIEQFVTALTQWTAPPRPATLPAGMTLVKCVRGFRLLPGTNDLPRDSTGQPQDIDKPTGAGVLILPSDTCGCVEAAARDLVEMNFAERVAAAP